MLMFFTQVFSVAWYSDGNRFVATRDDGKLKEFDLSNGKLSQRTVYKHPYRVRRKERAAVDLTLNFILSFTAAL